MASAENMENQIDSEMSFETALENYLNPEMGDLEEGSIVKGEVVRVDDDTVLVDVNFKSEGQIPAEEFRDAQGNMTVKVGDRVDVYVVRKAPSRVPSPAASRAAIPLISAVWKPSCPVPMWISAPSRTWTPWWGSSLTSVC